jgi:hypothetical protein
MKLLNEIFGVCIFSTNLLASRSPDLTPPEQQNLQCIVTAHARLMIYKTAITAYIRNNSQVDLQKVFANKVKRVQACINSRGHPFQHLL